MEGVIRKELGELGRKEEGSNEDRTKESGKSEGGRNDAARSKEHKNEDKLCIPRCLRGFDFLLRGLEGEGRVRWALVGGEGGGRHVVWCYGNWVGTDGSGAE